MTLLNVENISKRYGSAEVLKNISFTLDAGQTLAIIGPSGSGKTTLLRCLNFLEKIDDGAVAVRGETLLSADEQMFYDEKSIQRKRLHFGLVFQSFNLFPQYTALKNVTLARELQAKDMTDYKKNRKDIFEQINKDGVELLVQVGLSSKRDFYPHQLSGGQQQRTAIARALALKPDVLCFDEPTSALDPELIGETLKVMRGLAEKNATMIIVTHEMRFAREISDKVLFMDDGAVVEYGPPEEVLDNPVNERTKKFLERYSYV